MVDMTRTQLEERGWPLDEIMMDADWIEGRVLSQPLDTDTPFLTSKLYLEGTEPGAPPESPAEDEPWPPLEDLILLSEALSIAESSDDIDVATDWMQVPVAVVNLPSGRRVRPSDIAVSDMTFQRMAHWPVPASEVLLETEQFIGRTLRIPIAQGAPFTLSHFHLNEELQEYLDDHDVGSRLPVAP